MNNERMAACIYPGEKKESNPSVTDLGRRVTFTSSNDRKVKYGTLRYLGKPEFSSKGVWCGIELDEPRGKNNGSVQGIRYFSCPQDSGIFVPLSKVELDPIGEARARAKTSVTSLVEKRARKMGTTTKTNSPFFYNTMPRSMSLNQVNIASDKRTTSTSTIKSKPDPIYSNRSTHLSLKRYTSETNLIKTTDTRKYNNLLLPSKPSRRPTLSSFSEITSPTNNGSLRNSISCNDLSLAAGTGSQVRIKKFSLQVSPLAQDIEDGLSSSYYSSTSDLSQSDSDLTPRSSSTSPCFIDIEDTKLSLKPPIINNRFDVPIPTGPPIINNRFDVPIPTGPPINRLDVPIPTGPPIINNRAAIPTGPPINRLDVPIPTGPPIINNRAAIPTGLATPANCLIESSRNNKEYSGPSPEHQKPSKIYQNGKTSRPTLEHPLVNGHVAYNRHNKENDTDQKTFICPSSGQQILAMNQSTDTNGTELDMRELRDDITTCLKQQAVMVARISSIEENLLQFQSIFISTMEQVQDTLKKQMEFNKYDKYKN